MNANNDCIALFDLDGTLADYDAAVYEKLRELQSPGEPFFDIYNKNLPSWYFTRIQLIRNQPGWWEKLGKLRLGFDLLEAALEIEFAVNILTKGPVTATPAWSEKFRWCQDNLPVKAPVTVTEDKSLVYGRVLVDDYPEYQMQWLANRPRGLAVIPHRKGNEWFTLDKAKKMAEKAEWDHEPNVIRYDGSNLSQVMDAMQAAYDRESREDLVLA